MGSSWQQEDRLPGGGGGPVSSELLPADWSLQDVRMRFPIHLHGLAQFGQDPVLSIHEAALVLCRACMP